MVLALGCSPSRLGRYTIGRKSLVGSTGSGYFLLLGVSLKSDYSIHGSSPIDVEPVRVILFRLDGNTDVTYAPGGFNHS